MKQFLIAFFSLLPIWTLATEKFDIICGPYLQNVTENEVTVVWVTNSNAVSWVELAPDDETSFYAEERPQFFETNFGRKAIGRLHKVRLYGLEKATKYRYRIFSKEVVEETSKFVAYGKIVASNVYRKAPLTFKTLDTSKSECHFSMINDIHANDTLLASLLGQVDFKSSDFVVFNGDMLSSMESEKQLFDAFLTRSVQTFASELPFVYVRGNHEARGVFSNEYMDYFPAASAQPYYTFRQGPTFFIVMDGGEDKPDTDIEYNGLGAFDQYRKEQVEWLQKVIDSEDFKQSSVKIVLLHVPPVESTWHGSIEIKKLFIPLLNKAGINLMLSGHLHEHFYIPKGKGECDFPVLINSNRHLTDVRVQNNTITIRITDEEGKLFKEIKL